MQLLEGLNGPAVIIEDNEIGQDNQPKLNIIMFNTHFSEVFQTLKVKIRNALDLPMFQKLDLKAFCIDSAHSMIEECFCQCKHEQAETINH